MELNQLEDLPNYAQRPNLIVHYAPKKAFTIPIFILTNNTERYLFREVFNRYLGLGRYLIHRRLHIREPYSSTDNYGSPILSEEAKLEIEKMAKNESLRFKAVVCLEIDKRKKYYNNGSELSGLPDAYSDLIDTRHWQNNIADFQNFYKIDEKGFIYGSTHFYGDADRTQTWK